MGISLLLSVSENCMKVVFGSCLEQWCLVEFCFLSAGEEQMLCTKSNEQGGDKSKSSERLEQVEAWLYFTCRQIHAHMRSLDAELLCLPLGCSTHAVVPAQKVHLVPCKTAFE